MPDKRDSIVKLTGIERRYGSDPPIDALRGVNLEVRTGEWLTIAGPSGSGKSTLLNIIGCLDRQTAGSYAFEGIDVASLSDGQRAGLRSRSIGFVFQAFYLLAHRTVLENVAMAEVYRGSESRGRLDRAEQALERVQLSHRAEFLPIHLSGGERQRAAIARAVMGSPKILLCDEPTGNVDTATTAALLDLFAELNADGLTIIMITHDPDVAARVRRRIRIVDGTLRRAR
ncbi:MAG: ABC transporter ATP-binding protein [Candidatus Limnocylindria bacterium]